MEKSIPLLNNQGLTTISSVVDNLRNIIIGESNVGKSTFLYQLSNFLNENGYSVCLIDGDGSGLSDPMIDSDILHIYNKNDSRLFRMVNETRYIDIILIDDIGYLSDNCLFEISKSRKPIISTCFKNWDINTQFDRFTKNSKIFKLTKTTIEVDDSIIDRNKYLTQLKREIKLKSLLNEK